MLLYFFLFFSFVCLDAILNEREKQKSLEFRWELFVNKRTSQKLFIVTVLINRRMDGAQRHRVRCELRQMTQEKKGTRCIHSSSNNNNVRLFLCDFLCVCVLFPWISLAFIWWTCYIMSATRNSIGLRTMYNLITLDTVIAVERIHTILFFSAVASFHFVSLFLTFDERSCMFCCVNILFSRKKKQNTHTTNDNIVI